MIKPCIFMADGIVVLGPFRAILIQGHEVRYVGMVDSVTGDKQIHNLRTIGSVEMDEVV